MRDRKVAQRIYNLENPHKSKARRAVRLAKKHGILTPPAHCSSCGQSAPLEAHHPDHNKPLDVIWVCVPCHAKLDQRANGEDHGNAKLTWDDVKAIRARYDPDSNRYNTANSAKAIAKEYGVHQDTIWRIVRGYTWSSAALERENVEANG